MLFQIFRELYTGFCNIFEKLIAFSLKVRKKGNYGRF